MNAAIGRLCMVGALAWAAALGACQTLDPEWKLAEGVKTLPANGYPMAYVERGSGPTVVLVHGAINDYRYWTPQLDSLSSKFRVVSVSLRHYYPEPWKGEGDFSFKRHAEDLAAFIERLGGPVHLVAHSRGGPVAFATAHARPDLVRKLVLMEPALFALLPGKGGADVRARRARATEAYLKKGDVEGGVQFFFDDINGAGAWQRLPEQQRRVRRENAWTIVGQLGDVETLSCPDFGQLKMPVLLMQGERSPQLFKSIVAAARNCLPSAGLAVIPNAAHQMNHHNPAAFQDALSSFLD